MVEVPGQGRGYTYLGFPLACTLGSIAQRLVQWFPNFFCFFLFVKVGLLIRNKHSILNVQL